MRTLSVEKLESIEGGQDFWYLIQTLLEIADCAKILHGEGATWQQATDICVASQAHPINAE